MTLPALDLGVSSAGPPSDGTAPEATDPAARPEAPRATSSRGEAAPAKPPAASLVSIGIKGKPAGANKTGDLTRLFESARRQGQTPAGPSEATEAKPPQLADAEPESTQQFMPAAPPPLERPIAELPPELTASIGDVPALVPQEAIVSFEPVLVSGSAPRIEDAVASGPDSAPAEPEAEAVGVPDRVEAATVSKSDLGSVTSEALQATTAPMPEIAASVLDSVARQEAKVASAAIAEPAVAPIKPQPAPAPVAHRAPMFKELVDYWRSLRSGDDHPAAEAVDRDLVTERWPGTLLIAYTPASQDPRGELRPGRVTRLGTACAEAQSAADVGSHSTDWMLEVARTALINDEPVEEQQRLETVKGVAGFRMVALPLGPRQGLANAVLCILAPSPAAPRFGKRRVWL